MKRNELVDKLVSEGLSEKTLSKLTDNQLNILADRMLGEQMKKGDVVVPTNTDPNKIKQLTGQGLDVALVNKPATEGDVTEELKGNQKKIDKNHNGKIDAQDFKILKGQKAKKCEHCGKSMTNCSCDDRHLEESLFGGGHKKVDTIKHDGHEIDVFTKGNEKVYGHPRKEGTKGKNDSERLVYSDLEGLKKSTSLMNKGEKNVNFPKSKKISNPNYKSTVVDTNESKPSAGLSKEKKSEVVKKAKKGGDIDKKGKGFEKLANKAAKEYGSKEAGKKVAAAAMWKNIHESNSDLNAKRNLHFELKEAGVSDADLESKDINELAEKHSKNENVKNAHDFYKRVSSKKMGIAGEVNETKKWVNNLVENKYFHNFTSKGEIMELIQTKLNESDTMVQNGPKVKKGHNRIPEFMTYDAIVASAEPSTAPTKPTTKPGTKPSEPGTKPRHPYAPGRPDKEPNIKPDPKAQTAENKKKW